jgi:hypothetical protein
LADLWPPGISFERPEVGFKQLLDAFVERFVKVIASASCQASVMPRAKWTAHSKVFARAKY